MPLSGTLPDMKAQSADYIELQNIYKYKARRDIQAVTTLVRGIEKQYSLSNPVYEREIEVFCKNAQYMRLIRGKEDSSILTKRTGIYPLWLNLRRCINLLYVVQYLREDTSSILLHYAFKSFNRFYKEHNRAPGAKGDFDKDATALKTIILELLKQSFSEGKFDNEDLESFEEEIGKICRELYVDL
jgi:hypothetical protein